MRRAVPLRGLRARRPRVVHGGTRQEEPHLRRSDLAARGGPMSTHEPTRRDYERRIVRRLRDHRTMTDKQLRHSCGIWWYAANGWRALRALEARGVIVKAAPLGRQRAPHWSLQEDAATERASG